MTYFDTSLRRLLAATLFAAMPAFAFAQPLATQTLVVDDGSSENTIGDNGQFIWFNRFTPPPTDYPLEITSVQVVFGSTGVSVGAAIDIYFFEDTDGDGDPGTGAVMLGMASETVQFNDNATFSMYSVAPVRYETPGDVLIGVVNRSGFEGNADFPAAIDQGTPQVRSWVGTWFAGDVPATPTFPADEQWGTIDSFGFPGNWMIRATYEEMVVAIEPGPDGQPRTHYLSNAYPNPFNPQANITLEVAEQQIVRIAVFDALGHEVATLFSGTLSAGPAHAFTIDGAGLPSGIYVVRVTGELFTVTRRVTLMK